MDIRKTLVVAVVVLCMGAGIYLAWILLNLLYSYEPLYAIGVSSFLAVFFSVGSYQWYVRIERLAEGSRTSVKYVIVEPEDWDKIQEWSESKTSLGSSVTDPLFISFTRRDSTPDSKWRLS